MFGPGLRNIVMLVCRLPGCRYSSIARFLFRVEIKHSRRTSNDVITTEQSNPVNKFLFPSLSYYRRGYCEIPKNKTRRRRKRPLRIHRKHSSFDSAISPTLFLFYLILCPIHPEVRRSFAHLFPSPDTFCVEGL